MSVPRVAHGPCQNLCALGRRPGVCASARGALGRWSYHVASRPHDAALDAEGSFAVQGEPGRGYLRATPGQAWGFHYESGEPAFWGDTAYNLFGMAHCGVDVASFLKRRAGQGFNLLRVRVPVSPFHPPEGYSDWQTRRTWPWGGSEQAPRFDQFNLDYFHTVDQVVRQAESSGIGLEMIMEAWGFEFPFNSREILRARMGRAVAALSDRPLRCLQLRLLLDAAERVRVLPQRRLALQAGRRSLGACASPAGSRRPRRTATSSACTTGRASRPLPERFAADPDAVDAIMFQEWGARDEQHGWLATGIEDADRARLAGLAGLSAVFAEYGYERNPEFPLSMPGHDSATPEHTRRGAWRGAFRALGVIHGFENSWGPCARARTGPAGDGVPAPSAALLHRDGSFRALRPAAASSRRSHGPRERGRWRWPRPALTWRPSICLPEELRWP